MIQKTTLKAKQFIDRSLERMDKVEQQKEIIKKLKEQNYLLTKEYILTKPSDEAVKLISRIADVPDTSINLITDTNPITRTIEEIKQKHLTRKQVKSILQIQNRDSYKEVKKLVMDGIEENSRDLKIDDKYARIYYLDSLPDWVGVEMLLNLVNLPLPLILSYHIEGTDKSAMLRLCRNRIATLQAVQDTRTKKGIQPDSENIREMEEVEEFKQDLVWGRRRLFLLGFM
ncbi:MAG: hypothetical protein HC932_00180 [Thermales bacterium]|nr:hypothetical protein [Thermales bacterium]